MMLAQLVSVDQLLVICFAGHDAAEESQVTIC